ncbi:hypothetical protein OESDEN_01162 [Oesophagostomum dentatum]|uniref:Uncharacterized protein n=1 Tax=Oesophagostomum dentatum TaxID=61180 RepID=A0A0B1TRW2_OESDE|nr:hypothetical protein OESDEN_01162 [Oesophagostomum dentatum]
MVIVWSLLITYDFLRTCSSFIIIDQALLWHQALVKYSCTQASKGNQYSHVKVQRFHLKVDKLLLSMSEETLWEREKIDFLLSLGRCKDCQRYLQIFSCSVVMESTGKTSQISL